MTWQDVIDVLGVEDQALYLKWLRVYFRMRNLHLTEYTTLMSVAELIIPCTCIHSPYKRRKSMYFCMQTVRTQVVSKASR